jgi:hypothetical protein
MVAFPASVFCDAYAIHFILPSGRSELPQRRHRTKTVAIDRVRAI